MKGTLQPKAAISRNDRSLERATGWLVQLYQDWGKPEKAAGWRGKQP